MAYIPFIILAAAAVAYAWYRYHFNRDGSDSVASYFPTLYKYAKDLNRLAREKKLDPVVGREKEIARVIQILSRRTKNNPVLIGKAGVGKTAIVEGLAEAIVAQKVPHNLFGKRVLSLDLTGILAGTKYRGEFEQRLKRIVDEIAAAKRSIILFIDEIHVLAEAGEAEGAINAADILKPLLARGDLQVVGATTPEEYEQSIKKDKTLDRRMQPIFVVEPDADQARKILEGISPVYEDYHHVKITPEAMDAAVKQTKKITARTYPDKAIDAIDEACSMVSIRSLGSKSGTPQVKASDIATVVSGWDKK